MKQSILIVDDEPGIRESLTNVLEDEGYHVSSVGSGEACLETLQTSKFDVVLLDIWLPGIDGIQVLEKIQELEAGPTVIMISGHGTIETAVRSTKLGAFDFIEKPLSIDKTLLTLRHALEQSQLAAQNRELRAELRGRDRIIGDSVPMKALRQQLQLAAPTTGRVLIFGESGTGKELVAHALHNHSQRAEQPFVEVICAAIPEELIESELFGHIKGSFTGALEDKTGKFEQAHGGSLFLDEVGDMSLRTQSKVLRVIEEQRFTAVGSGTNLTVDVRIIAATNRDLPKDVEAGRFRQDLYYRLNVFPIKVVPLREHKEDIPPLAAHFLDKAIHKLKSPPARLAPAHLAQLQNYDWPGNVRELQNMIERALILAQNGVLWFDLPDNPRPTAAMPDRGPRNVTNPPTILSDLELRRRERENVLAALEKTSWKIHGPGGTAELLGVKPTTLISRIKKMGLKKPDATTVTAT